MKKLASIAVIPLFAGFLWAQNETTKTTTTTTKTTYNGTLVDAGCLTKHTEHQETTSSTAPGQSSTSTRTETTNTECPVTTTTTTFALQTPDGQYVRFDEPSNTRIVEVVKTNKEWSGLINDRKPVKARIVGTPNGKVVVIESIE
jgi:hypothetical protein